jgi:hypothetical protein
MHERKEAMNDVFFPSNGFDFIVLTSKQNNKNEGVTQYSFGQNKKQNPKTICP